MKRIGKDWLHWDIGFAHFGFHRHGNCWRMLSLPAVTKYGGGRTWFSWWRFFVCIG